MLSDPGASKTPGRSSHSRHVATRIIGGLTRGNPASRRRRQAIARSVIYRMAETGWTRFPVVSPDHPGELLGMIALYDLLRGRVRALEDERRRQRTLEIRMPFSGKQRSTESVG
jgi:hypothetical protein